jgi:hypothetical protein
MLVLQHGQKLLPIELLRVIEAHPHRLGKGLVSIRDHVEKVADRHDIAQIQGIALIDHQLHDELQRRAVALQQRRHGDQVSAPAPG